MDKLVPLYKLLRERGYALTQGELRAFSRRLRELHGYKCETLYDLETQMTRAHVNMSLVTDKMIDDTVAHMKTLTRIPPTVPKPAPTPLQDKTQYVHKDAIHEGVDMLLAMLSKFVRPDLGAVVAALDQVVAIQAKTQEAVSGLWELYKHPVQAPEYVPVDGLLKLLNTPPQPTTTWIAEFMERLAAYVPARIVQYMEAAEYLRELGKHPTPPDTAAWDYELPTDAVWRSERWVSLVYTDNFLKDWDSLRNAEYEKAIRSMLMKLTANPHHKSLNTHKRKFKDTNPPGTHPDCVYSRASDNVRVYWRELPDGNVSFERIIIKAG